MARKPLGLATGRTGLDPLIANDVREILSGLATVIEGIGSLRDHGGDTYGRECGNTRIDRRIASPCYPLGEQDRTLPDRDVAKKISDA